MQETIKPEMRIAVTEDDLFLAMSEMNNTGEFVLVGANGEQVTLVSASRCGECGKNIPDVADGGLVNGHHSPSCSLHGIGE